MATKILTNPVSGKILRTPPIVPVNTGYGLLYNGYAGLSIKFAPVGWRVPTHADYIIQIIHLGLPTYSNAVKEPNLTFWDSITGFINSSGLTIRGTGLRTVVGGAFGGLKRYGFQMMVDDDGVSIDQLELFYNLSTVTISTHIGITIGLPIRLIMNDPTSWYPGMVITDYEGNVYRTCKIGAQVWLADNWQSEYYNDGTPITNVTDNTAWSLLDSGAYCAYKNDKATYVSSLKPVASKILRITV